MILTVPIAATLKDVFKYIKTADRVEEKNTRHNMAREDNITQAAMPESAIREEVDLQVI
jgi:hypothetical protein